MNNSLSPDVQMQLMRPGQLEAAARAFPVVYVPFGLIEWHGRHLPLGNDALKAHAILVKTAEKHGGVVYPPVYYHSDLDGIDSVVNHLFRKLKDTGFRVIIGVSGHNVQSQISMVETGLDGVRDGKTLAGMGMWEITLCEGNEDVGTDHAAKWETSNMMFFYPDRVDMSELPDESVKMNLDMKPPYGIGGLDPRVHASAEAGEKNCEITADAIGIKAHELLESLPEDQRGFNCDEIIPGNWWMV
jgi:creatinine amidohydrolase